MDITGKYELTSSDKFDEYMKAVGVGMMTRKLAGTVKPVVEIVKTGQDAYQIKTASTFKSTDVAFKLGEQFNEVTADGRKCLATVTMVADNKMKHVQLCDGQELVMWREFSPTEMKMTLEAPGVVATRIYKKIG